MQMITGHKWRRHDLQDWLCKARSSSRASGTIRMKTYGVGETFSTAKNSAWTASITLTSVNRWSTSYCQWRVVISSTELIGSHLSGYGLKTTGEGLPGVRKSRRRSLEWDRRSLEKVVLKHPFCKCSVQERFVVPSHIVIPVKMLYWQEVSKTALVLDDEKRMWLTQPQSRCEATTCASIMCHMPLCS
jgi:hypothetical protein